MEAMSDLLERAEKRSTMYKQELKKELRSFETYFDQIGNFLMGLARVSGWWVLMTTVYTTVSVLLVFIFSDLTEFTYAENQKGLKMIIVACGGASALACMLSNVGKFQNIFDWNARNYVDRYFDFKREFDSHIATTDNLLLSYGLIKQEDIDARKKKALAL